ncbi:MAG: polyphosphate glucokinase [Desulfuromonas sp.]|nr:MAG: polyphosphate glucokinase [Desulfuromonas sp.]
MNVLGIDVGGSGIKAAPVDMLTGSLLADRVRVLTPQPATPGAVAEEISGLQQLFEWEGAIGCGFPAVIRNGVARTAANIDPSWVGADVAGLISRATGCPVSVINDADAAGLAEMTFGAGQGEKGTVVLITIGTGLGSAIFRDGKLLPNTELGHLWLKGEVAEKYASDATRKREDLSWERWAKRFSWHLQQVERLFSPDLFILGGGTSKKHEKFLHLLEVDTPIRMARLFNDAGIVGAALATSLP